MDRASCLLTLALLSSTACRSTPPPQSTFADEAPPPRVTEPPVKTEDPCTPGPVDLERWLSQGLLLIGEFHGTEEIPRVVAQTVCAASARGKTTWLALEFPQDDQEALETFLAKGDDATILGRDFWRREYQDGRNSQGMLWLLHEVRRMRAAGRDVRLLPFDVPSTGGPEGQERDAQMAARVAQARKQAPTEPIVLFVGNVHAARRLKIPRSMAWHLEKLGVPFKTLSVATSGGTAWMCGSSCGIEQIDGEDLGPDWRVLESPDAVKTGYDGLLYLGPITASPPAWKKP